MKNKRASMLMASLCLGVLLAGCGRAPVTGDKTAPGQSVADTQKETASKEITQKETAQTGAGNQGENTPGQDVKS